MPCQPSEPIRAPTRSTRSGGAFSVRANDSEPASAGQVRRSREKATASRRPSTATPANEQRLPRSKRWSRQGSPNSGSLSNSDRSSTATKVCRCRTAPSCSKAVCRGLSRTGYPSSSAIAVASPGSAQAKLGGGVRPAAAASSSIVSLLTAAVHRVPARQPMAHPVVEDVTVVGDRQHRGVAPRQDRGKVTRGGLLRHFGGEAAGVLTRIADPEAGTDAARPLARGRGVAGRRADAEAVAGKALAGPDGGAGVRVGEQDAWLHRGWLAYGISPGRMTS